MPYLEPSFFLFHFCNDDTVISLTDDIVLKSRATADVDSFVFSLVRCNDDVRVFVKQ